MNHPLREHGGGLVWEQRRNTTVCVCVCVCGAVVLLRLRVRVYLLFRTNTCVLTVDMHR